MNHGLPGGALLGVLVTMVNVGLLVALFFLFWQAYRRMRTPFGLGLLVFVGLLLVQDLLQVAMAYSRATRTASPFSPLFSDVLELGALLVLLYLATR